MRSFSSDDWEPFLMFGDTFYKCPICRAITSDRDEHLAWHKQLGNKGDVPNG